MIECHEYLHPSVGSSLSTARYRFLSECRSYPLWQRQGHVLYLIHPQPGSYSYSVFMKPFNVSKRFVILRLATSLWTNMQKRTVCPYIDCCLRRNLWIAPIISQTGKLLSRMHYFIQHAPSDLKCSRSYSLDGAVGNTYTNPQVRVLLRTI